MMAARVSSAGLAFVYYTDSGIAWRIGLHDHDAARAHIEREYEWEVHLARQDYEDAIYQADDPNNSDWDRHEMRLAAQERLDDDLQAAEDRRIERLDHLYPHRRWHDFYRYPNLLFVGWRGPCHFIELDIGLGGLDISWCSFLDPYPGCTYPAPFGWGWGGRHPYRDFVHDRDAYRNHFLAERPQPGIDAAYRQANELTFARHRIALGRPVASDPPFVRNHPRPNVSMRGLSRRGNPAFGAPGRPRQPANGRRGRVNNSRPQTAQARGRQVVRQNRSGFRPPQARPRTPVRQNRPGARPQQSRPRMPIRQNRPGARPPQSRPRMPIRQNRPGARPPQSRPRMPIRQNRPPTRPQMQSRGRSAPPRSSGHASPPRNRGGGGGGNHGGGGGRGNHGGGGGHGGPRRGHGGGN